MVEELSEKPYRKPSAEESHQAPQVKRLQDFAAHVNPSLLRNATNEKSAKASAHRLQLPRGCKSGFVRQNPRGILAPAGVNQSDSPLSAFVLTR
jgi:hypothetical protein